MATSVNKETTAKEATAATLAGAIKNKFSQMLAEKHSLSRLCVAREKGEADEILGEVITIEDADIAKDVMIDGEVTTFSVYTFKEYQGKYFYGGQKLTEIAPDLITIAENEGMPIADLNIQIMLKSVRTKGGNTFTDVIFM